MTEQQVALVLAKVQAFDNRDIGEGVVHAWFEALGDLDFAECLRAVTFHFAESKEWLMPAHIREIVAPAPSRLPSARSLSDHFADWPEADKAGPGYREFLDAKAALDHRGPDPAAAPERDPVRARALDRARRERPATPWAAHRGFARSNPSTDGPEEAVPSKDTGRP